MTESTQDTLPMARPALIEVRHLQVAARHEGRETPIVRDVSFEIFPGEILGIVGESGAAKSMTGAALTALLERPLHISGGEILYQGKRIDNLPPEGLRRIRGAQIATIFQDPLTSLNPVFTIGRQLVETIETHTRLRGAAARTEAVSLLRQVGIPAAEARFRSYPHEFSGGMRQRVVIALALAGRPKVIVADEPTTALDVSIQGQIISLLQDLCVSRDMAVMLVTHDIGVIAMAAHRVAVMYAGRIVEIGPVEDVLRRPMHPYTRGLMGSIPVMGRHRSRLDQIAGSMPRPDAIPAGCAFAPRCPERMAKCSVEIPGFNSGPHRAACWLVEAEDAA